VHEVFEHVVAPDIQDETDARLKCRYICKVLLRSHAEIDAAGVDLLLQDGNDGLKRIFVRHQLQLKTAACFGKVRDDSPKFLIGQCRGKLCTAKNTPEHDQASCNCPEAE